MEDNQNQTKNSFSFKWNQVDSYDSKHLKTIWKDWLFEKYFDSDLKKIQQLFAAKSHTKFLDAGCGAGVSALLLFGDLLRDCNYVGVDISNSVEIAKKNFQEAGIAAAFHQLDLRDMPDDMREFDVIFSEGVLHHTDSIQNSIVNLSKRLSSSGVLLFYVYRKKAPIREFTDDLVRFHLAQFDSQEAWEELKPLTVLGKTLGELDVRFTVKEDVPFLGIKAGDYDLQRFFYYHVFKAFYNKDLDFREMHHINFDWFAPLNCFRSTPEEIIEFCVKAGLDVERCFVDESGISVIARKFKL